MTKRKSAAMLNSDSDSGSSDSGSDIDKEMLSLAKKKGGNAEKKVKVEAFTSSSSSDSDSDSGSGSDAAGKGNPAKRNRRSTSGTTQSSTSVRDPDSDHEHGVNEVTSSVDPPAQVGVPDASLSSAFSSNVSALEKKKPIDLEEGEVSDDDDQDEDYDDEEFNDGYDDNLMGDAEDQSKLSAMTEKEREQEIYKRIEQREALKGRFEMEKKLRHKKRMEARQAKRGKKVDLGYADDGTEEFPIDVKVRSQERKKTVEAKTDKKSQALDRFKAAREAKTQRAQEKERNREREREEKKREVKNEDDDEDESRKDKDDEATTTNEKRGKILKASEVYSDDSESDAEVESKSKEKKKPISDSDSDSGSDSGDDDRSRKPQYVDKVEDLNKIRLSRFKMEKWVFLPFFTKVLKGCFIRIGVQTLRGGLGKVDDYEVVEILEVVEGTKIYQLGNTRTNKAARVRHGQISNKTIRFEYVSNQDFTQVEFTRWKDSYEVNNIERPTLEDIEKKSKEIKEAMEYQLMEEDIESIITEKARFKHAPVNFAAKKTELMKDREIAVLNGEEDKATEIANAIQDLDERAKVLDKMRTSSISSISYINERNRKKNVEEAEKAILEELRSNKGLKVEDPFTRRNTKPRIVSKPTAVIVGSLDLLGIKVENGTESETTVTDITLINTTLDVTDSKDSILFAAKPDEFDLRKDDQFATGDLFNAHDFDIKLDLDAKLPPNLPIVARPSMTPVKDTAPRRSLNLEEYKRKKGLI